MRAFSSSEKSQKLMVTESKDIVFLSYYIDSIPLACSGRVGYLWACLFVNKCVGAETLSSTTIVSEMLRIVLRQVTEEIIKEGRSMVKNGNSPLMFQWYGQRYWGAAHGLAGIMHVLMDVQLKPDVAEDVKGTLKYIINNRVAGWKSGMAKWFLGRESFWRLVKLQQRWFGTVDCSSRWGSVMGSVAMHMFLSPFTELLDGTSICTRQKPSPAFCLTEATSYSQKEKCVGGMAYLFLDMVDPSQARFPGYEL
ncbi:hypothetical protein Bca4012_075352 [Brassica carinata]|uniref:Uncharacterized protein n=1 Tax=Brassica carinata TaxID=52824 RepID=A0A8X7QC20_BRACI|nr:hypothetical protein Bca52824_074237 [Brassica carinata]